MRRSTRLSTGLALLCALPACGLPVAVPARGQEPAAAAPAAPAAPAANLPAFTRWIIAADYTRDGAQLLTAGGESLLYRPGDVVVWNAADGNRIGDLAGHPTAVWAVKASKDGKLAATAGYDGLVKLITAGKSDMPGLGFGMGDVVLTELLKSRGLAQITESGPDVFLLIEEESLRSLSLNLIQRLRDDGRQVEFSLTPARGDKQFKRAMELKARNVLRIERNSENQEMVWMKNLESRMEKRLALHEAVAAL